MDYLRLPFPTVQLLYDRIALLEWFAKHGEATDAELGELVRLKGLAGE